MSILSTVQRRLARLAAQAELGVDTRALPSSARTLSDAAALEVLGTLAAIVNDLRRVQAVVAGIVAERSSRQDGHSGLAATQGHSSPAALIQSISGGTRSDANHQVRVGMSLLEAEDALTATAVDEGGSSPEPQEPARPAWHGPLDAALLARVITSEQHDAIRRGLGAPPDDSEAVEIAWSLAADALIVEASERTVEDLRKAARAMRDMLDPVGAEDRFARRFENRSFRTWVDAEGQHHGHLVFDDEMALWVESIRAAALRPRRGGPRFMTDEERAQADALADDPRTNEQLQYDLLMDLLRAGAVAEAKDVFGTRQPGVRLVAVAHENGIGPRDALGRLRVTGHAEDGGQAVPGSTVDRALCSNGSVRVHLDDRGDPLDLGRRERLYSAAQKLAITVRDGACMARGCGVAASYCEVHHIDPYSEGGRTDIDRGILLCRFHHMALHNHGCRITRERHGSFMWHPRDADGSPYALRSKAPWKHAWEPPPTRERWRGQDPRHAPTHKRRPRDGTTTVVMALTS